MIGASGVISSRGPGTDGAQRQRDALVAEGIEVTVGRTGEMRVDLGSWGWFPPPGQGHVEQVEDEDTRVSAEDSAF